MNSEELMETFSELTKNNPRKELFNALFSFEMHIINNPTKKKNYFEEYVKNELKDFTKTKKENEIIIQQGEKENEHDIIYFTVNKSKKDLVFDYFKYFVPEGAKEIKPGVITLEVKDLNDNTLISQETSLQNKVIEFNNVLVFKKRFIMPPKRKLNIIVSLELKENMKEFERFTDSYGLMQESSFKKKYSIYDSLVTVSLFERVKPISLKLSIGQEELNDYISIRKRAVAELRGAS